MLVYAAGSLATRIATVLCVLLMALPFLSRRRLLAGSGGATAVPYLRWMWPHFWMGYIVLGLSLLHASTVMRTMGRADVGGIWAATGALFVLMFEVLVGLSLRKATLVARIMLRRIHS